MQVLVMAASKHGATAEIDDWIAATLRAVGLTVTREPPEAVTTLDGVDAVVLGSAVYAGHWLDPARDVVERLGATMAPRPVFLFSSGPVGDPPKPDGGPAEVERWMAVTHAVEHRVFPGRIDRARLGFGERAIVTALRVADGDDRPRQEIEAWARQIAATLAAPPVPTA
jgi:menaquinone-dependent protoporphyrinogen oxidase